MHEATPYRTDDEGGGCHIFREPAGVRVDFRTHPVVVNVAAASA